MSETVPTTITALEGGVLARLEAQLDGIAIEAFPDKPGSYRLLHQVGALLVCYRGAKYGGLLDTDATIQKRDMQVDVHVLTRGLAGHQGAYAWIEAVRTVLIGWKVSGFGRLSCAGETFVGHDDGVWTYAVTFGAETMSVAVAEDEVLPLLEQITAESEYTTSEVPGV